MAAPGLALRPAPGTAAAGSAGAAQSRRASCDATVSATLRAPGGRHTRPVLRSSRPGAGLRSRRVRSGRPGQGLTRAEWVEDGADVAGDLKERRQKGGVGGVWEAAEVDLKGVVGFQEGAGEKERASGGTAVLPKPSEGISVHTPGEVSSPSLDSRGEQEGSGKFVWSKEWYPVALIQDLDPAVPTPFTLLGTDLVLWRDSQGIWRAHSNLCPHRLAPLSEGRIDEKTGDLQCAYHGWTFRGDGSCSGIPQAATTGPEARAAASPRACVAAYPAVVSQGLLWVWPEAGNWGEALGKEPTKLPAEFEDEANFSSITIQRDLFYGYDVLMENVCDPSHIDFAHHKFCRGIGMGPNHTGRLMVTGRRDRAKPLPFDVSKLATAGFSAVAEGNPKITTTFEAPCAVFSRLELSPVLPIIGKQNWTLWICSFNVPIAPGKTRSIVCSARNFARVSVPGDNWWQLYPRWLEHLTSNKVYDGDMIVLQGQEKALLQSGAEGGVGRSYGSLTFTPAAADRVVLAFRNWLRKFGGGNPKWDPACEVGVGGVTPPLPSTVLSKREMLDRFSQHTEKCSSCKAAYNNLQRATLVSWGLSAAVLATAAALPGGLEVKGPLALAALGLLALGTYLKLILLPQFEFVDYVHAHID